MKPVLGAGGVKIQKQAEGQKRSVEGVQDVRHQAELLSVPNIRGHSSSIISADTVNFSDARAHVKHTRRGGNSHTEQTQAERRWTDVTAY